MSCLWIKCGLERGAFRYHFPDLKLEDIPMRGTFWPVVLIVIGGLLLLSNLGILPLGEVKALAATWWPLILILIGVTSLLKKGR